MYGLDLKELNCFSKGCSLHTSEGYSLMGVGGGINGREALAARRWRERAQVGREATPSTLFAENGDCVRTPWERLRTCPQKAEVVLCAFLLMAFRDGFSKYHPIR